MFLKKYCRDGKDAVYLCQKKVTENEDIEVYLIQDNKSYLLKINDKNKAVLKWAKIIDLPVEDYLKQLVAAINDTKGASDDHEQVFYVDKKLLVWEQLFNKNDKKITGKMGKFNIEEIDLGNGVREILDAILSNRENIMLENDKLQAEAQVLKAETEAANKLAAKGVAMKENLENEILSKFVSILNAKTRRIEELEFLLSNSSGNNRQVTQQTVGSSVTTIKESLPTTSAAVTTTTTHQDHASDEEFERDTDVDSNEEIDTDDEATKSHSASKRKLTTNLNQTSPLKAPRPDSSDLFNLSIEAELHEASTRPVESTASKQRRKNNSSQRNRDIGGSVSNKQSVGSYFGSTCDSSTLNSATSTSDDSILKQFFNC